MKIFELYKNVKFDVKDNDTISAAGEDCNIEGFTAFSFERNGSIQMTGEGSSITIFKRLLVEIKKFNKENPNEGIIFESAASDSSRVEFYNKFAQKIADEIDFHYDMVETSYAYVYILAPNAKKLKKAVEIVEDEGLIV